MAEFVARPIIGLEIHVQLATRTKMFCGCPLEFGAPPNSRVCPVCGGLPGALPVINRQAFEYAVRTALALNCRIAALTKWDRKSYYYPDLPKNYQISQYDLPLGSDGRFEISAAEVGDAAGAESTSTAGTRAVRIRRAHLEEDAGKNTHEGLDHTRVDLNRAGTPLLEIVTEPDLRSADEAREFAVQLQRLVHYLHVSEANMQMGQMRFEPNINVRISCDGREHLTPIVEVKNLNSFRALHAAIEYEVQRQVQEWLEDGRTAASGNKSNRGWDDERGITLPQREKEEAHDYRYFTDPDIPALSIDPEWVARMRDEMPELPLTRSERIVAEYKVSPRDAPAIAGDRATADLLDHAAEAGGDKQILGKHFLSFWSAHANQRGTTIAGLGVSAEHMGELARLQRDGLINATAAGQIAEALLGGGDGPPASPRQIAERLGLLQSRDEDLIAEWVAAALAANARAVEDARGNPKKMQAARGFLTGQVMKLSGGKADPRIVAELIDRQLGR